MRECGMCLACAIVCAVMHDEDDLAANAQLPSAVRSCLSQFCCTITGLGCAHLTILRLRGL